MMLQYYTIKAVDLICLISVIEAALQSVRYRHNCASWTGKPSRLRRPARLGAGSLTGPSCETGHDAIRQVTVTVLGVKSVP